MQQFWVRTADDLYENWIKYIPNTSLEYYHYTNLLSDYLLSVTKNLMWSVQVWNTQELL
jgi:hypothetical protein